MRHFNLLVLLNISILYALSCASPIYPETPELYKYKQALEGKIILGNKLENPYSISNIRNAYEVLATKGGNVPEMPEANWLYVRFQPKDSSDFRLIEDMELYQYPLDYEILQDGDTYHDPAIPDDEITWMYTRVPVDFRFPDIRYEIIDECFVPKTSADTKASSFYDELENLSIELTGNALPDTKAASSRGCPEGYAYVEDKNISAKRVPIAGVKIRCNYFLKFADAYTDDKGYYRINTKFSQDPHYDIIYRNTEGFVIWNGLWIVSPASTTFGRAAKTGCNLFVKTGDKAWSWSVINNAGYDKSQADQKYSVPQSPKDMKIMVLPGRPTESAWGATPMLRRIWAVGIDSNSLALDIISNIAVVPITTVLLTVFKLALPDMILHNGYMENGYYSDLYYHVWHEFSHASHFAVAKREYWHRYASILMTSGFSYGSKSHEHSGIVDVGESWAEAYTNYMFHQENPGVKYYDRGTFDSGEYFTCSKCLSDILERNILTPGQLVKTLTNDVRTNVQLKDALTTKYPHKKTEILNLFYIYGI